MNIASHARPKPPDLARWTLWIGRGLLSLWVGFWVWFNIASGIGEMAEHGAPDLVAHGLLALVLLGIAVVAWRWRLAGGITLLGTTVAFAIVFGFGVAGILLAPPALAGALLITSQRFEGRAR